MTNDQLHLGLQKVVNRLLQIAVQAKVVCGWYETSYGPNANPFGKPYTHPDDWEDERQSRERHRDQFHAEVRELQQMLKDAEIVPEPEAADGPTVS